MRPPVTQLPKVRAIGTPNADSGVATRTSHAAAMAQPPPTAKPWICAIVGFATRSSLSRTSVICRSHFTPSAGV